MKLTIPPSTLADGLAVVSPIAGKRSVLPILGCVLIRAEKTKVTLCTSNLDMTLELDLPVTVDKPGECVVPCGKLAAALAKIGSEDVTLRGNGKALELQSGGNWMKLFAFPAEEFPPPAEFTALDKLVAPGDLGAVLESAGDFVSLDETRYVLNGVLFEHCDDGMALVSTDGRRLFRAVVKMDAKLPGSWIVPLEATKRLVSLCAGGEVKLAVGESQMRASGPTWRLTTKLIEGNFPNYAQVIPANGGHRISVSRKDLLKALPFVGVLTTEKSTAVLVTADSDGVVLTTSTPELGEARAVIDGKVEGGAFRAGYNAKFFAGIFNAMRADEVTLDSDGEVAPLKVEQDGFVSVLMPLRVS